MAFLQGRGQVSMIKPAPNWKWNRLSLAASGLSLGLQLCSWIAMWEQQSFHGPSLICKNLNRWPATPSKPVSVVNRFSFCTLSQVKLLFNSALLRKKCTNRRHIWPDFQVQGIVGSIFSWGILSLWISDMKRRNDRCSSSTNVDIALSDSSR